MKSYPHCRIAKALALLVLPSMLSACGGTAVTPAEPTLPPVEVVVSTATSIPASTHTPAPTPFPGTQVYPLSSLGNGIPWLPLEKGREPMTVYYGFNFNTPPFNDLLVRQAFAAAVDREAVAAQAAGLQLREVTPATTLTPPSVLGRDLYGEVGVPFDPARAKALLEQAGYSDPESFPKATLIVYLRGAAPGAHFRIAQSVADMWKAHLGVTVAVEAVESPYAMEARMQTQEPEMYLLAWGADVMDPDNFLTLFLSRSEFNHGHFKSPAFDGYVNQAGALFDPAERQILYMKAEQIISEQDVALIPLFHTLWYEQP